MLKKLLYTISGIIIGLFLTGVAYAQLTPFTSKQLAPTPSTGNCLTTNGLINSWSPSCGAGGGGGNGGNLLYLNPQNGYYVATTSAQWMIGETSTTTKALFEVNGGIFANASSTIEKLTTQLSTTTNSTTTNQYDSNGLTIAALNGPLQATNGLVSATTIGNLFSTTSFLYALSQNTGNAFSTTSAAYWGGVQGYLTGNQTITLTGDITGSGATSISTTLKNTGAGSGSCTNCSITFDAQGRETAYSNGSGGSSGSGNLLYQNPQNSYYVSTTTAQWLLGVAGNASTTKQLLEVHGGGYFQQNVGIGTTSPYDLLSVAGEAVAQDFVATSTTATSSFAAAITVGTGQGTSTFAGNLSALQFGATNGIFGTLNTTNTTGTSTFLGNLDVEGLTYLRNVLMGSPNFGIYNQLTAFNSGGQVSATSTPTANNYIATTSTASQFPYASTTEITATTASTTNLYISALGENPAGSFIAVDPSGHVIATTTPSGGGGGAVSSVSNSDSSLTISPTTGAVVASINLAHTNTFTANQAISQSTNGDSKLNITNTNSGSSADAILILTNNLSDIGGFVMTSGGYTPLYSILPDQVAVYSGGSNGLTFQNLSPANITFDAGTAGGAQETLTSGGNLGIGSSTPWAKLAIGIPTYSATSPMFAIGSSTSSGTTTPFIVAANGHVGVATTTPTTGFASGAATSTLAGDVVTGTGSTAAFTVNYNGSASLATTSQTGVLNIGPDSSSATTTIEMGKIQFDGYSSTGSRVCAEIIATSWVITAGACTP